jgi:hypothetical protein
MGRFTQFLIVLLSPASAIRAHDVLARPLLEGFHPVAIARLFCTQARFFAMAGEFLRELRFPALPRCPCREPTAAETERFASAIALRALERFLRRNQMDPQELLQSPMRADQTSRSFCPRCLAQFTAVTGICQDCGGVALVPFCLEANL